MKSIVAMTSKASGVLVFGLTLPMGWVAGCSSDVAPNEASEDQRAIPRRAPPREFRGSVAADLTNVPIPESAPHSFAAIGTVTYFAAYDPDHGVELWKSDGTAAGTALIKDINFGRLSSEPRNLTAYNGTLYFSATDPSNGVELWKSDGTAAGTVLVKDILPGTDGSSPDLLQVAGGRLFFFAQEGSHGAELWSSDGTAAGTALVKDLKPGTDGSYPRYLYPVGTRLFFSTFSTSHPSVKWSDLWVSNGTAAGTTLLKSFYNTATDEKSVQALGAVNGKTLLRVEKADLSGQELWVSDGAAAGTTFLMDLRLESSFNESSGKPTLLPVLNGALYFRVRGASGGSELWKTDGTLAGTVLVRAFTLASALQNDVTSLTTTNGFVYFTVDTSRSSGPTVTDYTQLWKSDGTTAGTTLVSETQQQGAGALGSSIYALNTTLIYRVARGGLWKSDGAAAGTSLLNNVYPFIGHTGDNPPAAANGKLLFAGDDGQLGIELWKTDGSVAGTGLVKDIFPYPTADSSPHDFATVGAMLYFQARDEAHGRELWRSDGTAAGTTFIKDINLGTSSSDVGYVTSYNGAVYFGANDGTHGFELWRSDGTAAGTALLKDIVPGSDDGSPMMLQVANGKLFFFAQESAHGGELWSSDGTAAGTALLKDIRPGTDGSYPRFFFTVGAQLYFTSLAAVGPDWSDLWVTNGTPAGTTLVQSFPGKTVEALGMINGKLVFRVLDANTIQVWSTTGTAASTTQLAQVNAFSVYRRMDAKAKLLPALTNALFFPVAGAQGGEVWKTDGTAAGTALVKAFPGSGLGLDSIATSNGSLYIGLASATDGNITQLWKSNGTTAGTTLVTEIAAGGQPYAYPHVADANGTLIFRTLSAGLWKSNGTAATTSLLQDIDPFNYGSIADEPPVLSGTNLLFPADTVTHGFELWKTNGTQAGTVLVKDIDSSPGYVKVTGRVTNAVTGLGIPNAQVCVVTCSAFDGYPTNTDDEGYYGVLISLRARYAQDVVLVQTTPPGYQGVTLNLARPDIIAQPVRNFALQP